MSSRDFPNEIFGFGQFALFAKTPLLLRAIADAAVQLVALLLITIINNRVEGARAVPIDGSAVLWLRLQLESDAQSGSHRLR